MDPKLRLALAQLNLWVGDISGNTERIIAAARHAREQLHADVVLFPELALTSYPPEDLLLRPGLHWRITAAMEKLRHAVHGIALIVGHPHSEGGELFNACSYPRGTDRSHLSQTTLAQCQQTAALLLRTSTDSS